MADNCRQFITAEDNRPFFLYFCTADPHRGGGKATELPHQPDRFGNREKPYPGVEDVTYNPKDVVVPDFLPDTPECRAELAQYYQAVSRVDRGVGRLIEHLKKAGKYDNTVVIYISDNGIPFPAPRRPRTSPASTCRASCARPGSRRKASRATRW